MQRENCLRNYLSVCIPNGFHRQQGDPNLQEVNYRTAGHLKGKVWVESLPFLNVGSKIWLVFGWPAYDTLQTQTSVLWQTTWWKSDHKTYVKEKLLLLQRQHNKQLHIEKINSSYWCRIKLKCCRWYDYTITFRSLSSHFAAIISMDGQFQTKS